MGLVNEEGHEQYLLFYISDKNGIYYSNKMAIFDEKGFREPSSKELNRLKPYIMHCARKTDLEQKWSLLLVCE